MKPDSARVLIIDDEPAIRNLLRLSLENEGFSVSEAEDGKSGVALAATFHPHLILLDLGLPDKNGLEVLKSLRAWTSIPILILTINEDQNTKVALLDGGADDYLTKPFGIPELLARVRVALRHHGRVEATPLFRSKQIEVDLNQRSVRVKDQSVKLTTTEFSLLSILIRHNGKVVPQAQLLSEVWGPLQKDQTHYLRIYIAQLRKKIEDDSSNPVHILTEPGIGYRIV